MTEELKLIMNQYTALLVNLGQGSSKINRYNSKESRKEEILASFKEIAKDHHPDLVLFQEGTSKRFLKDDLVKVFSENIPDSQLRNVTDMAYISVFNF